MEVGDDPRDGDARRVGTPSWAGCARGRPARRPGGGSSADPAGPTGAQFAPSGCGRLAIRRRHSSTLSRSANRCNRSVRVCSSPGACAPRSSSTVSSARDRARGRDARRGSVVLQCPAPGVGPPIRSSPRSSSDSAVRSTIRWSRSTTGSRRLSGHADISASRRGDRWWARSSASSRLPRMRWSAHRGRGAPSTS